MRTTVIYTRNIEVSIPRDKFAEMSDTDLDTLCEKIDGIVEDAIGHADTELEDLKQEVTLK